jgi:hypothetical protein
MTTPSRHVISALLAAFSVIASIVIVLVALEVATGATPEPGSTTSYSTEYMDVGFYALIAVFPFVLGVAAAYSVGFALLGTVGVFAVSWWAMYESNERLAAAGWSDGLEVLGYLAPIGALLLTLVFVLIGALVGRSKRRQVSAQDQYTTTLSPTTT